MRIRWMFRNSNKYNGLINFDIYYVFFNISVSLNYFNYLIYREMYLNFDAKW